MGRFRSNRTRMASTFIESVQLYSARNYLPLSKLQTVYRVWLAETNGEADTSPQELVSLIQEARPRWRVRIVMIDGVEHVSGVATSPPVGWNIGEWPEDAY